MDSFEINKILGAVLGTVLIVMALSIVSEGIYQPATPEKPGFVIAVAGNAGEAAAAAPAQDPPIEQLLASAKPDNGAAIAKKCQACHNLVEGAGAKVGPDLYSVVDRPIGSIDGFKYSDTFQKAHAAGEKWTYDNLYAFLKKPSTARPGTAMGFVGLPKPTDRADVIAYLRTLSHNPEPLPAPAPAAPAKPAAAAPAAPAPGAPAPGAAAPAAPAPGAKAPAGSAPATPAAPNATPATPAPAQPSTTAPAQPAAPTPAPAN